MNGHFELWAEWKEHYRDVRANAKDNRMNFLTNSDLDYTILSDKAAHVRIHTNNGDYDVWLGSGKWTKVGTNKYNQGWIDLLKIISVD